MKQASFFKELFIFRKPNEDKFQLVGAGICMAIPLFIGYFTNNPAIGNFGSLGIFTFLYYKRLPFKKFLTHLSLIGIFLLLGNLIGILSSSIDWLIPITIACVSFLARIIFRIYQIEKPGAFFIVMVTSMGTSMALPLNKVPLMMSYFFLGIVVSILVASIIFFINRKKEIPKSQSVHWKNRLQDDPSALLDALNYATILFLASYLSQSLQLPNAYWMTVSCAAVLQGENLKAIMHRNIQRILGTIIGVLIAGVLLSLPLTFLQTILLICFLFVAVEFFVKRNYIIANFFTTPMALLLANLARQQYIVTLLSFRLIGITLGSLLGLVSAFVLTKSLKFYHKAYSLDDSLEQDSSQQ